MSDTSKLCDLIEEALNDGERQMKADAPGVAPDWYPDLKAEYEKHACLVDAAPLIFSVMRQAVSQLEIHRAHAECAGTADIWDSIIERGNIAIKTATKI